MKQTFHVLMAFLMMYAFIACNDTEEMGAPVTDVLPTYTMRLQVGWSGYDGTSTRAASYSFVDKDHLYILFQEGSTGIVGTATYTLTDNTWAITPSQSLSETDDGHCKLAFFLAAGNASASSVALTQQTCIYSDANATYQLVDGLLTVQGLLSPALGRIRFSGTSGQQCTATGLAFANSFDLTKHTFTLNPGKVTATCGTDGFTPYYYCGFDDNEKRQITFEWNQDLGFLRSFDNSVLQAATSGYVVIPTADNYEGYTLVNLGSGVEIRLAQVSSTVVSGIVVNGATLQASVTDDGDGRVSETGFCYATSPNPTISDYKKSCGATTASFTTTLTDLQENTHYYVRAYVTNERGTNYGEQAEFQTPFVITLPTLSAPAVTDLTSKKATFASTVTSSGHGTLKRAGFCYSTTPNPTVSSTVLNCGKVTSLRATTSSLEPQTTYYVRAFAENEKGVAYSEEKTFTTKEKPGDTKIGLDDYSDDNSWDAQ